VNVRGGLVLVLAIQPVIGNQFLALGLLAVIALLGLPVVLRLPARTRYKLSPQQE
jgi:hypothetical protein